MTDLRIHETFQSIYFFDPNRHRLEFEADTAIVGVTENIAQFGARRA